MESLFVCRPIKSIIVFSLLFFQAFANVRAELKEPFGLKLGDLGDQSEHGVSGKVYAVDANNLYIKDFKYDGKSDAVFWIDNEEIPSVMGEMVHYPEEAEEANSEKRQKLPASSEDGFLLRLPINTTVKDIKSFALWDSKNNESLGRVTIPKNLTLLEPRVLPEFLRLAHDLRSGNVTILDAKTFLIPNLHYDGKGPDAYFMVGTGSKPHGKGTKVPNERGSLDVLHAYRGETIVIQLPEPLTVYKIDWLVMWCIQYKHNFGYVMIPKDLSVPPALGQNKIGVLASSATLHHFTLGTALLYAATVLIFNRYELND